MVLIGGPTPLCQTGPAGVEENLRMVQRSARSKIRFVALAPGHSQKQEQSKPEVFGVRGGIDIGKRELTVTILTGPPNQEPQQETRTFGTVVPALQECLAWLLVHDCRTVVMESTGTYWVPVWNVLQQEAAVILANPEHVKALRGEKTDPEDSSRLAEPGSEDA